MSQTEILEVCFCSFCPSLFDGFQVLKDCLELSDEKTTFGDWGIKSGIYRRTKNNEWYEDDKIRFQFSIACIIKAIYGYII